MSIFAEHPITRWAVPAGAAVAVAAATIVTTGGATASTPLPPRTAAQLLTDVQQSSVRALSGTVVQTSDLGLPSIAGLSGGSGGPGSSADLTSMLSGTHTLRVWLAGADQQRVALLGDLGESDVVRNGRNLWVWSSQKRTADHYTLPSKSAGATSTPTPEMSAATPGQAASTLLSKIDPTTSVTTEGTATVAGRSAYELVLTPKGGTSLVKSVRIAIDSQEHVPLRVQVYSAATNASAFSVGFTSVDFTTPEARQFSFTPPSGTTVTTKTMPSPEASGASKAAHNRMTAKGAGAPRIVGKGWSTVVVASLPAAKASASTTAPTQGNRQSLSSLAGMAKLLPTASGSWGHGHVLSGTLFSAVITDDGRIAVGAVRPEALFAALSAK